MDLVYIFLKRKIIFTKANFIIIKEKAMDKFIVIKICNTKVNGTMTKKMGTEKNGIKMVANIKDTL